MTYPPSRLCARTAFLHHRKIMKGFIKEILAEHDSLQGCAIFHAFPYRYFLIVLPLHYMLILSLSVHACEKLRSMRPSQDAVCDTLISIFQRRNNVKIYVSNAHRRIITASPLPNHSTSEYDMYVSSASCKDVTNLIISTIFLGERNRGGSSAPTGTCLLCALFISKNKIRGSHSCPSLQVRLPINKHVARMLRLRRIDRIDVLFGFTSRAGLEGRCEISSEQRG